MRLLAAALVAALAASMMSPTAEAGPRLKRVERGAGYAPADPGSARGGTVIVRRDETGRTRTKILVQKRSYLDGGTEVMPADNVNSFRSTFMSYRPGSVTQNTPFDRPSWINDPFFLPGARNPYPWAGN